MRKPNYYKNALKTLEKLYESHPDISIGRHFSTAFADYGDVWGLSNKEFNYALEKYAQELEMDTLNIAPDEYVQRVYDEGLNLENILKQEDEDEY